MTLNPIPPGYHTVTPYLIVSDAAAALEFYRKAFDAVETDITKAPDGRIKNVEFRIGDSMLMMGEHPAAADRPTDGWPPVSIYLYVPDADATWARATAAGATGLMPVGERPYGNREGGVRDAFGVTWWIATRVEVVSPEELAERLAASEE